MRTPYFILFCVMIVLLLACGKKTQRSKENKESPVFWGYVGETAPEHWAEIEKNSDCSGKHQSPVNIVDIDAVNDQSKKNRLQFIYSPITILTKVENNGHSVQFDFTPEDSMIFNGETYYLKQLHFHSPSEHTINGVRYPLEVHLVHITKENKYAVVSIMGEEGTENEFFEFFNGFLPIKNKETKTINHTISLTNLFPKSRDFYFYQGSLTTPPCTEGVNWIIFKKPVILSLREVTELRENMPLNNYRTEQPLNGRVVKTSVRSN